MNPIENNMNSFGNSVDSATQNREPEKKPFISSEQILKFLSQPKTEGAAEKKFAPGEGIVWSPADEEDKTLAHWLNGEDARPQGIK